jgi:hypothetical protein
MRSISKAIVLIISLFLIHLEPSSEAQGPENYTDSPLGPLRIVSPLNL